MRGAGAAAGAGLLVLAAAVVIWAQRDRAGTGTSKEEPTGPGLPGYQGSAPCMKCHAAQYREWKDSLHARTVHEPSESEKELLSRALLCGGEEARFVLGERHSRRFMVDSVAEPGRHVLLPCRYDVAPAEWVGLHESDWQTLTWEKGCGACHTAGFSSDDLTFSEMGVGCESCHGPASRHAGYATRGEMVAFKTLAARDEIIICASCHLQGGRSKTTGLNYARNYQPGDDLFEDYEFDWSELDTILEETDNPIDIHQKLLIRDAARGAADSGLRCTSCHEFHRGSHGRHEKLARQDFCHLCHAKADFTVKDYRQSCNVCEF